jgi:hypothetical protein
MVSQCRHELNEQATKSFRILCSDSEEISSSRHVRVVVSLDLSSGSWQLYFCRKRARLKPAGMVWSKLQVSLRLSLYLKSILLHVPTL